MWNSVYRGGYFSTLSRFKIWDNRNFKKLFLAAVALMEGLAAHLPQLLESPLNWELGRRPGSWWGSREGAQGRRRWVLFRSRSPQVALSYCPLSARCQWGWRKPLGTGKPSHPPSVGMMAGWGAGATWSFILFGGGGDPEVGEGRSRLRKGRRKGFPLASSSISPLPLPLWSQALQAGVELRWEVCLGGDVRRELWREEVGGVPQQHGERRDFLARKQLAGHLSGWDPLLICLRGVRTQVMTIQLLAVRYHTALIRTLLVPSPKMSVMNAQSSSMFFHSKFWANIWVRVTCHLMRT